MKRINVQTELFNTTIKNMAAGVHANFFFFPEFFFTPESYWSLS